MSTGQGTTWVLVADAHHARVLAVEDAGLPARLVTTLQPPPPEAQHRSPEHGWTHGADPRPEHEERRFSQALVQALERGAAANQFRHLVIVASANRLRASTAKDWGHVADAELAQHVRPLVEIWPR